MRMTQSEKRRFTFMFRKDLFSCRIERQAAGMILAVGSVFARAGTASANRSRFWRRPAGAGEPMTEMSVQELKKFALCLVFLLLACLSMKAQDFRATITGQVTDQTKSVVPSANVRASNIATNASVEVRSNAHGYYTLPYLNPGTYNVECSAPGFTTLRREGIVLQVAD